MTLKKTEWFTKNRVVYQSYTNKVTFKDLQAGRRAITELQNTSSVENSKLHVILDLTDRESIAPEVMSLQSMREIFTSYSGKQSPVGWFIIIQPSPHPVMRFVCLAAAKVAGIKLRVLPTIDSAYTFLRRADTSLPDSFQPV